MDHSATTNPDSDVPIDAHVTVGGAASDGVDDMCTLGVLDQDSVLQNLQVRFARRQPYTYSGPICIAVNPYQWLPIYGEDVAALYRSGSKGEEPPPHVYAVSAAALDSMERTGQNQSILVSGESGAGKTETTKILLKALASAKDAASLGPKEGSSPIVDKVLRSNPVLESFGNAKTVRNNNSSRFGKLLQLRFTRDTELAGAANSCFLLEKSRVVRQSVGERNYHIFYQLLSLDAEALAPMNLRPDANEYQYTQQGAGLGPIDERSDAEHFADTAEALRVLGVSQEQWELVLQLLASILHLGNVKFEVSDSDEGKCVIASSNKGEEEEKKSEVDIPGDAVLSAANLLQCDAHELERVLLERKLRVNGEWFSVPLRKDQAEDNRDALSKGLYTRLFDWIVTKINASVAAPREDGYSSINVLDIFGFEHFEKNSFEQLCINYANEKLQQRFNLDVFEAAQQEYVDEGVPWEHIPFADNQHVVDVFEGRLGVLSLLNEECMLPKGNDDSFARKLVAQHADSSCLKGASLSRFKRSSVGAGKTSSEAFVVSHFAGNVEYDSAGMVIKNKDNLQSDLLKLIQASRSPLVATLASSHEGRSATGNVRGSVVADTVCMRFRKQLGELMSTIGTTKTHYIRCLKPNSNRSSIEFDEESVTSQLRCAGVLEAIRVSRAGYPHRLPLDDVVKRFAVLMSTASSVAGLDAEVVDLLLHPSKASEAPVAVLQAACHQVLGAVTSVESTSFVGKTKVFFGPGALEALEAVLGKRRNEAAVTIASHLKMRVLRRHFLACRRAAIVLQSRYRGARQAKLYRSAVIAAIRIQSLVRGFAARMQFAQLRRRACAKRIQAVWRRCCAVKRFSTSLRAVKVIQHAVRARRQRVATLTALANLLHKSRLENRLAEETSKASALQAEAENWRKIALEAQGTIEELRREIQELQPANVALSSCSTQTSPVTVQLLESGLQDASPSRCLATVVGDLSLVVGTARVSFEPDQRSVELSTANRPGAHHQSLPDFSRACDEGVDDGRNVNSCPQETGDRVDPPCSAALSREASAVAGPFPPASPHAELRGKQVAFEPCRTTPPRKTRTPFQDVSSFQGNSASRTQASIRAGTWPTKHPEDQELPAPSPLVLSSAENRRYRSRVGAAPLIGVFCENIPPKEQMVAPVGKLDLGAATSTEAGSAGVGCDRPPADTGLTLSDLMGEISRLKEINSRLTKAVRSLESRQVGVASPRTLLENTAASTSRVELSPNGLLRSPSNQQYPPSPIRMESVAPVQSETAPKPAHLAARRRTGVSMVSGRPRTKPAVRKLSAQMAAHVTLSPMPTVPTDVAAAIAISTPEHTDAQSRPNRRATLAFSPRFATPPPIPMTMSPFAHVQRNGHAGQTTAHGRGQQPTIFYQGDRAILVSTPPVPDHRANTESARDPALQGDAVWTKGTLLHELVGDTAMKTFSRVSGFFSNVLEMVSDEEPNEPRGEHKGKPEPSGPRAKSHARH